MSNGESKRDKFKRLAGKRVNKVIEALRIFGNLSNRAIYDYTEEDVDEIFGQLNEVITEVNDKFHGKKNKKV